MIAAKPLKGIPYKPMRRQLRGEHPKQKLVKTESKRQWPKRKFLTGNRFTMSGMA